MQQYRTLEDLNNLNGKVVMLRADLNVPMDENFNEYYLDDEKKLFLLLTRMQDEVHRYAITTHIKKRNKSIFNSVFDDIDGIGEKRKEQLQREMDNFPLEDMKEMALNSKNKNIGQ